VRQFIEPVGYFGRIIGEKLIQGIRVSGGDINPI
jgi:hypothetical protein